MQDNEALAHRVNEAHQEQKLGMIALGVSVGSLAIGTVLEHRGVETFAAFDGIGIGAMYFAYESRKSARQIMQRVRHEQDVLAFLEEM